MYYVQISEGIRQPRVLGGYSDVEQAKQRVSDHITDRGKLWEPEFKERDDGTWLVTGPDEEYTIWKSQ